MFRFAIRIPVQPEIQEQKIMKRCMSFKWISLYAMPLIFIATLPMAAQWAMAADEVARQAEMVDPAPNAMEAHRVVENTTSELVALIEEARTYIDQDEQKFFEQLGGLLHNYVDFASFSRAVMGKYASSKRFENLSEAQRVKLQEQIDRFTVVFTNSLINTYGKGLLVFEGERIEVLPPGPEAEQHARLGKARVKQLIYGDRDEPYVIYYSLRRSDDSEWKIRNMVVESSNLGKIYRNQFDNAYKVYDGDIDRVIDNWVVTADSNS